jgi:hypothetical protein
LLADASIIKKTYYKPSVLVLCTTFTVVFVWAAWSSGRAAVADLAYRENNLESLRRSVEIAPGNAVYRALLAEHLEGRGEDPKPQLVEVTRLTPLDSQYWIGRAFREEIEGRFDAAEALLKQAASVDNKASPRWALMNFYFRRGRDPEFWFWVTKALAMNDGSAPSVFRLAWEKSSDSAFILSHFPNRGDLMTQYYFFLAQTSRLAEGGEVVERAARLAPETAFPSLLQYCDAYSEKDTPRALAVWNTLCRRGALPFTPLDSKAGSIITNPDFAIDMTGQGFDWHAKVPDGVLLGQAGDPEKGVRVEMTGNQPEDCVLLTQVLPLSAGLKYEISWESLAGSAETVSGLMWEFGPSGGQMISEKVEGLAAPARGSLKIAAASDSGRLQLRYKRPLGSVRARGTIIVRGLRARVLP